MKISKARLKQFIKEELNIALSELDESESVDERELTKPEKKELKSLEKKTPKKDFKDQYEDKEGESIYYATLTKKAKEKA